MAIKNKYRKNGTKWEENSISKGSLMKPIEQCKNVAAVPFKSEEVDYKILQNTIQLDYI